MPRSSIARLKDIAQAIDDVGKAVGGAGDAVFKSTDRTGLLAVAAAFVIIGEAVKALPADIIERHPEVDWSGFVKFRDVLVHQYFRIEPRRIRRAINKQLPVLKRAVEAELAGDTD
jgi:uncharacterized protein with HEPN domain